MELPWLEKYRPKVIEEITGNEEAISRLAAISNAGNVPNILFSGPAGTGKTSSIMCLARKLLGEKFRQAVLELNASDERGIDVVRNKIKSFAQTKVSLPEGRHKIIILDEADNITSSAQNALRRTMEIYADSTRFLLSCNISSKIIEAIQSRCAILRYTRLSKKDILDRILTIIQCENIQTYEDSGLEAVVFLADGDMRNAINTLQAAYSTFGKITADCVYEICDVPPPLVLKDILILCSTFSLEPALDKMEGLFKKGYMASDIISAMFRVAKYCNEVGMESQIALIKEIGSAQMRVLEGANQRIMLCSLVARLCNAIGKSKTIK